MDLSNLNLKRPLVFFDTETTGVNIVQDRIIELCAIKIFLDKSRETFIQRFNPGIPIPPEATTVHGITDEMVANEPSFSTKVSEIVEFFSGCDLAGYNLIRFDIPLLVEELLRNGVKQIPFEGAKFIDCMAIWRVMEPRTLSDAVKYYTGEVHEEAHAAQGDAEATISVLAGQLAKYPDLSPDPDTLHDLALQGNSVIDYAGKFSRDDDGDIIFTFGKNSGQKVKDNLGMLDWMLSRDFPAHTKYIARKILNGELS